MHRFFVPSNLLQTQEFALSPEISHQISRVLHLKPGSKVMLLDNTNFEYLCRLEEVSVPACKVHMISKNPCTAEPSTRLTLLIGITQREKFELILQKCTELGVSTFTPFISSRTLVQRTQDVDEKAARWMKIVQEAAEQSHRGMIPTLNRAQKLENALDALSGQKALKLVLWEDEVDQGIKSYLSGCEAKEVILLIGPEGGLSSDEVEHAKACGFAAVSLGKRILRMETAAMMAAGLAIYELG